MTNQSRGYAQFAALCLVALTFNRSSVGQTDLNHVTAPGKAVDLRKVPDQNELDANCSAAKAYLKSHTILPKSDIDGYSCELAKMVAHAHGWRSAREIALAQEAERKAKEVQEESKGKALREFETQKYMDQLKRAQGTLQSAEKIQNEVDRGNNPEAEMRYSQDIGEDVDSMDSNSDRQLQIEKRRVLDTKITNLTKKIRENDLEAAKQFEQRQEIERQKEIKRITREGSLERLKQRVQQLKPLPPSQPPMQPTISDQQRPNNLVNSSSQPSARTPTTAPNGKPFGN